MRRDRHRVSMAFLITVAFLFAPGVHASSSGDAAVARTAYIDALFRESTLRGEAEAAGGSLQAASRRLERVVAERERAIAEAIAPLEQELAQAGRVKADLAGKTVEKSARLAAIEAEIAALENQIAKTAAESEDRVAGIEELERRLESAERRLRAGQDALAGTTAEFEAARRAYSGINDVVEALNEGRGSDDQRIIGWARATYSGIDLASVLRIQFFKRMNLILGDGTDVRLGEIDRWNSKVRFEEVPAGRAYLLWDKADDVPFSPDKLLAWNGLERIGFRRLEVPEESQLEADRLEPVEPEDLPKRVRWADVDTTAYTSCLGEFETTDADAARWARDLCRLMHPGTADHEVVIAFDEGRLNDKQVSAAYVMSGAAAQDIAAHYRDYLSGLRDLSKGNLPATLLPLLKELATEEAASRKAAVAAALRVKVHAAAEADTLNAKVHEVATNREGAMHRHKSLSAKGRQMVASLEQEMAGLEADLEKLSADRRNRLAALDARRREQEARVADLEARIAAKTASVEADWQERIRTAEAAEVAAKQGLTAVEAALTSAGGVRANARSAYLEAALREKSDREVKIRVYFDGIRDHLPKICISILNKSKEYIKITEYNQTNLRFNDANISIVDEFFRLPSIFENSTPTFENKYGEFIEGLRPSGNNETCHFIGSPFENEVGRYFDSIGGFSEKGWDFYVDVRFGTFEDTEKSITVLPLHVLFAEGLASAEREAKARYKAVLERGGSAGRASSQEPVETNASLSSDTGDQEPRVGPDPGRDKVLSLDRSLARDVQLALNAAGFDAGPADGLPGSQTKAAIAAWQASRDLEPTSVLTVGQGEELLGRKLLR